MDDKEKEEIALFRYGLISPVIHENIDGKMRYLREIAGKEYDVPYLGRKRFKVGALKSWLRKYNRGGFDALKPKTREDKGMSRKIDDNLALVIKEKTSDFPTLSCAAIYRLLIAEGEIEEGGINEGTLRKYIQDNNLKQESVPIPRKKYEKEHVNELWIGDCLHGPYIQCEKKKKKIFLIAVIDDMSRVIVGGRFFFHENSINLEIVLKEAIRRFGVPEVFCL